MRKKNRIVWHISQVISAAFIEVTELTLPKTIPKFWIIEIRFQFVHQKQYDYWCHVFLHSMTASSTSERQYHICYPTHKVSTWTLFHGLLYAAQRNKLQIKATPLHQDVVQFLIQSIKMKLRWGISYEQAYTTNSNFNWPKEHSAFTDELFLIR